MYVGEGIRYVVCSGLLLAVACATACAEDAGDIYLGDAWEELAPQHTQAWGSLGLNTAAKPPDGRAATP
ncbi:MAG TPA: hypothetical protein PKW60_12195, partial [Candidatus Hydrogenedentes bacterium]|nr:hypothetical protein [Candidatus Hydrogenedentota bacterium]